MSTQPGITEASINLLVSDLGAALPPFPSEHAPVFAKTIATLRKLRSALTASEIMRRSARGHAAARAVDVTYLRHMLEAARDALATDLDDGEAALEIINEALTEIQA